MIDLDEYVLIESDIDAGGGASLDLYFDLETGKVLEDKTTCDGTHLYAEVSIEDAMDNLTDEQVERIADGITNQTARIGEMRKTTKDNEKALQKLVAEMEYALHEIGEIKEAIEDYYYPR